MENIKQKDRTYIAGTYARFDLEISEGKGSVCRSTDGKEYIDLTSGIGVNSFGFADSEWISAVTSQLSAVQHTSNLYYTSPDALLAEKICERAGMKKVFFCNSGAEANECAIKAARKYASQKRGEEANVIITLERSFHGRTLTTLAATGQEKFHKLFTPLTPGFVNTSSVEKIRSVCESGKAAAVMIECVQGEGGVLPLEKDFVSEIAEICEKNDVLLICDEVQTGNGRTGKLYSFMHYGIVPDVFTTAKGLGGGLPIGACVLGEKVKDIFDPGDNGSTFGGNPAVCAGAISVIDRLSDEFLEKVRKKSELVFKKLESSDCVRSVSGLGLMIGIEPFGKASDVVKICMKNGVLVLTAGGNKVRLLPPLNIPENQLEKAVDIVISACEEVKNDD